MNDYYSEFKPIRNLLKKLNIFDVLCDLKRLKSSNTPQLLPEIIEFLYINAVIYGKLSPSNHSTYNKDMHKIISKCSLLHDEVNRSFLTEDNDPFLWFHKTSMNQSKSHSNNILNQIFRFYTIFSNNILRKHIENCLGINYHSFMLCTMWLYSIFREKGFRVNKSFFLRDNLMNTEFNRDNINKVLNILTEPIEEFKVNLKASITYDDNIFIFHNRHHLKKPIFEYNNILCCFYYEHLLKQVTSGIYYLAKIYEPTYQLGNAFGASFEKYIGIILDKINKDYDYVIEKEITYSRGKGKNKDKTSDWIIINDDDIVFIECKTKRTRIDFKFFQSSESYREAVINETALAIKQIYKVFDDYSRNIIKGLPYFSQKNFIPIVVYLEDDQLNFLNIEHEINIRVKELLMSNDIDSSLPNKYPFHIYASDNFEIDAQIMFKKGFSNYFYEVSQGNIDEKYKLSFQYIQYFDEDFSNKFLTSKYCP